MSLMVAAYEIIDGKIEWIVNESESQNNDLFGTESTRNSIWSSKHVIDLGCSLLPKLRIQELYCIGEDLIELEKELRTIQLNIEELKSKLSVTNNYLEFRVNNGLKAIQIAKSKGKESGVYIG